jgi:hypothetical protein
MSNLFKWKQGRQEETEYLKYCFMRFKVGSIGMDGYILKYEPHTILKPHKDTVKGRHYRLNIELLGKGKFVCEKVILNIRNKVYLFRPDLYEHSVINHHTRRYVLSFGLAILE